MSPEISLEIRNHTKTNLTEKERERSLGIGKEIKEKALYALNGNKGEWFSHKDFHCLILLPHGGGDYANTEVIIDISPTAHDLSERTASYMFFQDITVNRTGFGLDNNNYEVGPEELSLLLKNLTLALT